MSNKQLHILFSWGLVGLALFITVSYFEDAIPSMMLGNFLLIFGVWLREQFGTISESDYWGSALSLSNRFRVVGLIYMLIWLAYILYAYFTNIDRGERILSDQMLLLFLAPIILIVVYHELVWFMKCRSQG